MDALRIAKAALSAVQETLNAGFDPIGPITLFSSETGHIHAIYRAEKHTMDHPKPFWYRVKIYVEGEGESMMIIPLVCEEHEFLVDAFKAIHRTGGVRQISY